MPWLFLSSLGFFFLFFLFFYLSFDSLISCSIFIFFFLLSRHIRYITSRKYTKDEVHHSAKQKNTITVQKQSRSLKRQVKNIMNPNQMTRGIGSRGREERNFFTTIIFLTTKQIITSKMTTRRNSTPPAPPLMQCPLRREEDSNFISSLIA